MTSFYQSRWDVINGFLASVVILGMTAFFAYGSTDGAVRSWICIDFKFRNSVNICIYLSDRKETAAKRDVYI